MNLLDIFEGREPHQQAIDRLEQARIDHLKEKMDYYAQHGMLKDFQKAKTEHDGYYQVNEPEPSGVYKKNEFDITEPQDECMGYGGLGEAGIGQDIVNRTEKMARATPSTPASKVVSTAKNAAKWLAGKGGPGKEGPTYEGQDQKKNSEEVDEAGGGWALDPKTRLELKKRKERQKTIAKWAGKPVPPQEPKEKEVDEGFQDFNRVEPYEVCLAGKCVKTFDYYEDARRFHDNWKKKLYAQGEQAKADKITLNPIMKEAYQYPSSPEAVAKQKATINRPASTSTDKVKTFAAQGYTIKFKPDVVEIYHGANLVYSKPGNFANPTRAQLGAIRGRVTDLVNRKKKEMAEAGSLAQQAAIAIAKKKEKRTDEDQDTSGVEQAIIRRIMVAHTDLLIKFGPQKVMQAAEEVAYNVGDVDEIGSSDVSAYVNQVRQILGAE